MFANEKFYNAVNKKSQKIPPVWFMRQAGRYHKHYQALRAKHSFMDLCKKPELAAEVARGPVADFDFDVAILFSDLLFPLEAMGMGLTYGDGGPALGWHLDETNINKLIKAPDALPMLKFQNEAMKLTRKVLPKDKSLIGFVGGPWTLFTYAVQGGHDGNLIEAKKNLNLFAPFCEILMPLLLENIQLQFDGGAEVIMLFDTAAGELMPHIYEAHVVPQLKKITKVFPKKCGYYSKGTHLEHLSDSFFKTDFAGLGVDHRWDIKKTFDLSHGFIQGNFDQSLLFQSPDHFKKTLSQYLEGLSALDPQSRAGWVSGLGHGVLPKTPEENVRNFVKTVREVFK